MMSHDLQWYYPEKISEALKLIKKEGVILHAGGTRILKTEARNLKGLVDISRLPLNYIRKEGKDIIIGAGCTITDVINYCKKTNRRKNKIISDFSDSNVKYSCIRNFLKRMEGKKIRRKY